MDSPTTSPVYSTFLRATPPLITPSSPPPTAGARQLNPAYIRPLVETIDRAALWSGSYTQPPLSRIEGAEILLELRYGRRERSREGTVEEEELAARPSPSPFDNKKVGGGNGPDKEGGPKGGTLWGSRLRAKTKRSSKLTA